MEEALSSLRSSVDEKEFLRLTRTALRLVQNVLNEPAQEKYRKIRAASKVVAKFNFISRPGTCVCRLAFMSLRVTHTPLKYAPVICKGGSYAVY